MVGNCKSATDAHQVSFSRLALLQNSEHEYSVASTVSKKTKECSAIPLVRIYKIQQLTLRNYSSLRVFN